MQIPNNALQGIGAVAASPLGRAAVKYWWATAPIGYLAWHYWQQRKAKGQASVGGLIHDLAPVVGTVVGLITLNQILAAKEAAAAPLAAKPVEFTVQQQA